MRKFSSTLLRILVLVLVFSIPLQTASAWNQPGSPSISPASARLAAYVCPDGDIPKAECGALVDFYNSTGGPGWYNQGNWLVAASPCGWQGVQCQNLGLGPHVVEIDLGGNNLTGTIPASFTNLSGLQYLMLPNNALSGLLPANIGSLSGLINLHLGNNQFSGQIPTSIGGLTALDILNLSNNQFSGPIPAGVYSLTNLSRLNLQVNQLTGGLSADIAHLSKLTEIGLHDNQFTGIIPPEIGTLAYLEKLRIGSNAFSGSIPSQLGSLTALQSLEMSHNNLSGTIPNTLGNLTNLVFFGASFNQLSGSIPSGFSNLTLLQVLDVEVNQLSGPLPNLSAATGLQILSLNDNLFSGVFPPWATTLNDLSDLELMGTFFNFTYFPTFVHPEKFTSLQISGTLIGKLPAHIGSFSSLDLLNLSGNPYLLGPLPPEILNLSQVTRFSFGGSSVCVPETPEFNAWIDQANGWDVSYLKCAEDEDLDGVPNGSDNAPLTYNPEQLDNDNDGLGDIHDPCLGDPKNVCLEEGSLFGPAIKAKMNKPTQATLNVSPDADYDLTWDWGDGTVEHLQTQYGSPVVRSHVYPDAGVYNIQVTIVWSSGASAVVSVNGVQVNQHMVHLPAVSR